MWTRGLYCPKCEAEFKEVLPNNYEGGYEVFTCPKCNSKIGVWLRVETFKVAVLDSDPKIIENPEDPFGIIEIQRVRPYYSNTRS
jgi:DNA-directed RNA polymerase subunit RPC12/RpoP